MQIKLFSISFEVFFWLANNWQIFNRICIFMNFSFTSLRFDRSTPPPPHCFFRQSLAAHLFAWFCLFVTHACLTSRPPPFYAESTRGIGGPPRPFGQTWIRPLSGPRLCLVETGAEQRQRGRRGEVPAAGITDLFTIKPTHLAHPSYCPVTHCPLRTPWPPHPPFPLSMTPSPKLEFATLGSRAARTPLPSSCRWHS